MSKRSRRPSIRHHRSPAKEELNIVEWQVPAIFNFSAAAEGEKALPLRILDQFKFVIHESARGSPALAPLDKLAEGLVRGKPLHAEGLLLDHKLALQSLADARAAAYAVLSISNIQDWVVDYSEQACIWIVTTEAWYRLAEPALEYAQLWNPILERLQLAKACYTTLQEQPFATHDEAVGLMLPLFPQHAIATSPNKPKPRRLDQQLLEVGDQSTVKRADLESALKRHAAFLASTMAVCLGRHAAKSGFLQSLAAWGAVDLQTLNNTGRSLLSLSSTSLRSADPLQRPPARTDFIAPRDMQPSLLMIWDFCQSHRQLLRLPPFPLSRLESGFAASEGDHSCAGSSSSETALLRDLHLSLVRILEGTDTALMEPPTLAGYGSAAELYPKNVYRPLLNGTWPELVRLALLDFCVSNPRDPASIAVDELKVKDYWQLSTSERLALLKALVHIVSDTVTVREQIQDSGSELLNESLSRGLPLGVDDTGTCYYQLASDSGKEALFVEVRERDHPEAVPGSWGWYPLTDIPQVVQWLDSGSTAEKDLAEDVFQAFQPHIYVAEDQAKGNDADSKQTFKLTEDGYSAVQPEADFAVVLRHEILSWFGAVRFWEKSSNWLQAQAAVVSELKRAENAQDFARMLFIVEDMVYVDVMKGTGWGRKRSWCKDQLETCRTMAQAGVIASQIAWHGRKAYELGIVTPESFKEELANAPFKLSKLPILNEETVFLKSGYAAHIQQAQPPKDALAYPLPKDWGSAEHITIKDISYARGNWQRPSWQGRSLGTTSGSQADDLFMACLLVERRKDSNQETASEPEVNQDDFLSAELGEIDWGPFSFQFGFRQNRPIPPAPEEERQAEALQDSRDPGSSAAAPEVAMAIPSDSTSFKIPAPAHPPAVEADAAKQRLADAKGLRRSGRVRNEIVMHDYEAGSEAAEAPTVIGTRSRRGQSMEISRMAMASGQTGNYQSIILPPVIATAEPLPEDEFAVENSKFWKHDRDLASILFYVRRTGPVSVEYLLPLSTYGPSVSHTWQEGTIVKMPANLSHPRPTSIPDLRWFTGTITATFLPGAHTETPLAEEAEIRDLRNQPQALPASVPTITSQNSNASVQVLGKPQAEVKQEQPGRPAKAPPEPAVSNYDCNDTGTTESEAPLNGKLDKDSKITAHQENKLMPEQPGAYLQLTQPSGVSGDQGTAEHIRDTSTASAIDPQNAHLLSGQSQIKAEEGSKLALNASEQTADQSRQREQVDLKQEGQVQNARAEPITKAELSSDPPAAPDLSASSVPPYTAPAASSALSMATAGGQRAVGMPIAGSKVMQGMPTTSQPTSVIGMAYDKILGGGTSIGAFQGPNGASQAQRPSTVAPGLASMLQRPATHLQQGLRLSELVPQHAARGLNPALLSRPPTTSGGPGGPHDPWKALAIRWDYGTPPYWPIRVSPWEVSEDVNGAARLENTRIYSAMLAKQSADAAAFRQMMRPLAPYQPQGSSAVGGSAAMPMQQIPGRFTPVAPAAGIARPASGTQPYRNPGNNPANGNSNVVHLYSAAQGKPYHFNASTGVLQGQTAVSGFRPLVQPPQQFLPVQQQGAANNQPGFSLPPAPAPTHQDNGRSTKRRRSSPADDRPAGRVSTEGYRERWMAKRPRPNPHSWLSGFCSACETGAEELTPLLPCMGPCLRAFHGPCVGLQGPPAETWFCPECESGKMRCFICGEYSSGFDDPGVRKCSLGVCGRFYHTRCAEQAPLAQMAKKGGHFRCPQHYCATCGKSGDGVDMVKCIRCPIAYHSMCMNSMSSHRLHPQSKVILCEKHEGTAPPAYKPPPLDLLDSALPT